MGYRRRKELLSDVLNEEQVEELLAMYAKGLTYREIAEHFEIHRNTVYNIVQRKRNRRGV